MPTCSAYGCTSSTRHKGNRLRGIFFHDFPKRDKSPERYQIWMEYCNRKDFNPGANQKSACLCSRHFRVTDMDESQLLKIKMMPEANLRGPRLKPGAIPSVDFEFNPRKRKTSKIPKIPYYIPEAGNKSSSDEEGFSSKKLKFSHSLVNWRKSIDPPYTVSEEPKYKSCSDEILLSNNTKSIQCELGLEMLRYSSFPDSISSDSDAENVDANGRIPNDLDVDKKCDESTTIGGSKEGSFAAWGNLLLLFRICNVCSREVNDVNHGMRNGKVYVRSICSCGNKVTWTSKPS